MMILFNLSTIMDTLRMQVLEIIIAILALIKTICVAPQAIHSFYFWVSENSDQTLTSIHVDWRTSLDM